MYKLVVFKIVFDAKLLTCAHDLEDIALTLIPEHCPVCLILLANLRNHHHHHYHYHHYHHLLRQRLAAEVSSGPASRDLRRSPIVVWTSRGPYL